MNLHIKFKWNPVPGSRDMSGNYLTQFRPMRGHISVKGGQAWIYANQVCRLLEWTYIPNLNEICLLVHEIMSKNSLTQFRPMRGHISVKIRSSVTTSLLVLKTHKMKQHIKFEWNPATVSRDNEQKPLDPI